MSLKPIPTLAQLLENPGRVADLPAEAIAELRGQLARLDTLLLSSLLGAGGNGNGNGGDQREGDRLLDAKEAAAKLRKSTDALYRRADEFPFTVRDGRQVRFSEKGIEKYIQRRMGK